MMRILARITGGLLLGLMSLGWSACARAAIVNVTVTFENLAPTNTVAFAPLRVGFHNGTFDSFNIGTTATDPIISVAERGNGATWFQAFAAADPGAVLGTVGGAMAPQLVPNGNVGGTFGSSGSQTFTVDTSVNRFFSFASMVVPSNDLFIGNDNPTGFQILDNAGNLLISQINQTAAEIWDANSEEAIALNGAFIVGATNANRVAENGVVAFDFSELSVFNGLTTNAGYTFNNSLTGATNVGRISLSVTAVPEPGSMILTGLIGAGLSLRRLRRKPKAI